MLLHLLLFTGFDPSDLWGGKVSTDFAEFAQVVFVIGLSIAVLVAFDRWWSH